MPAPAPLCAALFSLASAVLRPGEDRREEPGAALSFWGVSAMLDAYVVYCGIWYRRTVQAKFSRSVLRTALFRWH